MKLAIQDLPGNLELEVPRVNEEKRVKQVHLVQLDLPDLKDHLEMMAPKEILVLLASLEILDLLVNLALLALMALLVKREKMGNLDNLDLQVHLENLDLQDLLVKGVHQDHRELKADKEKRVLRVNLVLRDPQAKLAQWDLRGLLVNQVLKV